MGGDSTQLARQMGDVATSNPTLTLLGAYSRDWVIPLFAEHLWGLEESVSPEWFHERVADAVEAAKREKGWQSERTPAEHCAKWVNRKWLDTEFVDGRVRYVLSASSLRALEFVREVAEGGSSVSGARLGSIADAVRRLADMSNPNKEVQKLRIQAMIDELKRRYDSVEAGRGSAATVEQMREQLLEILTMTRSLPADFRRLRGMVEERHKAIARHALAEAPKADMVEAYLYENDLLAATPEGVAYRRFARMLSASEESATIQRDIDQILRTSFAREHMSERQRQTLEGMFSTLLSAELQVQEANVRWTNSLRRVLTRATNGRHGRLLSAAASALDAAVDWAHADPRARGNEVHVDVLRVGVLDVEDASQVQLWRDTGAQVVSVTATATGADLPTAERASLRLAAGTSRRIVAKRIDRLVSQRGLVTGAEVYEATPPEFKRLGTLVSLLDLAVRHGRIDVEAAERVLLERDRERALEVVLPHLVFDTPVGTSEERT